MTLAHGTDWLESARLVLRRIAPDDLPFFTRIHALPEVAQYLYPGGRPRSPEESAAWLQATLESYEPLALGYLAVLRKEDGALIGGARSARRTGRRRISLCSRSAYAAASASGYRPWRKSTIAALTSTGRSCCVQWPQPGSMTVFRSSGTNRFRLGMS